MKPYLFSLAAGLLVGVIYSLIHVRSPAPPVIALIGLLGMLIGEQVIPVGKQLLKGTAFVAACDQEHAVSHVFGELPGRTVASKVVKKDHS
ncbi:XapX domain-containing protein [Allopusillimonas ginsengisoli]|uniref:XapX domain-containing protein n=1 Tax=Allopusillimonas ginsengisoli TaxID=453575 RepID=UPI00101F23D7|nr:XapX domain-containing protein [Allopusillimonas ginsengisoli]TEA77198.1 DUF1427 family protein [Allopusillimonas ginsengisoli]